MKTARVVVGGGLWHSAGWGLGAVLILAVACSSPGRKDGTGAAGGEGAGGQAGHADAPGGAGLGGAAAGGLAGQVGQGGQAGSDAGAGPDAAVCTGEGLTCAGNDGAGVCCGGTCVPGSCCASTDCAKLDGGAGSVCVNHQCSAVANGLAGLLWQLPCKASVGGTSCTTDPSSTVSTQLTSVVPGTFNVTLRFRGVVEQKTYTGGCTEGAWVANGSYATGDTYNIYKLTISSPPQTYFLNAGGSGVPHTFAIDLTRTVLIDAGATVTLEANAVDGEEIKNVGADATTPVTVDVTSPAQPYDGQFIKMDIVDIALNPASRALPSSSTGSALKFGAGQYVLVPRSATLEPADVTVEAWTTFAGGTGGYNSVLGKPYGTSTADSYTMWFQSGDLNAGTSLTSPTGAVTVPWSPRQDAWHHLAMTHDDTAKITSLYVDGLLVSCTPSTAASLYDDHPLYIGADVDNGTLQGFWNGAIDELRIFSKARTAAQVWTDMHAHKLGPTAGLVAEWTFDEGTGQTVSDSSGNGATGTLGATAGAEAGDPTWSSPGAP